MADAPGAPVVLAFAGLAGVPAAAAAPTTLSRETGDALRGFFDAHPTVAWLQFEIALNENGDDLEFAGGTLHGVDGRPLGGRAGDRAGDALRRMLRTEPHLAALPVSLVIAMGGVEATFRVAREATGAGPATGEPADPDARAAGRERERLRARDERFDQRDVIDDDHVA